MGSWKFALIAIAVIATISSCYIYFHYYCNLQDQELDSSTGSADEININQWDNSANGNSGAPGNFIPGNSASISLEEYTPVLKAPKNTATPEPTKTPKPKKTPKPTETSQTQETPDLITTPVITPAVTPEPTKTSSITSTATPGSTKTPVITPAVTLDPTKTPQPTKTPKQTKTPTPTATLIPTPTATPAEIAIPTPTSTSTSSPTSTPAPTLTSTPVSTPEPTPVKTLEPTASPTTAQTPASTVTPFPEMITNLSVVPESQAINSTVNISYQTSGAGNVTLLITYPNGTTTELIKSNVSTTPYTNTTLFNITQFGEYAAKITVEQQNGNVSSNSTGFYGIEVITNSTEVQAGNKTPVIVHKDIVVEVIANKTTDASVAAKLSPSNRSVNASAVSLKDVKTIKYIEIAAEAAENISNVTLKVNYTSGDTSGLDEATLGLYFWDSMNDTWYSTRDYAGKDIPGGPHIDDAGVDTSVKYVWADLNHLGIFAIGGLPPGSSNNATSPIEEDTNPSPTSAESDRGGSPSAGGGGGNSGEDYRNIEKVEKYEKSIYKDVSTSYQFTQNGIVDFVNITGNVNADSVSVIVEVLSNTSSFVNVQAPGLVYRNVNIWAGTSGFAVPRNIKEATVTFRVDRTWVDENNISDVVLYHYSDGEWVALPTMNPQEASDEEGYMRYRATTDSFSPFAIVGVAAGDISTQSPSAPTTQRTSGQKPVATARGTTNKTAETTNEDWGAAMTVALVGIVAAALTFIRKQMK